MTDENTIAAEWGTVWAKNTGKTHLMPSCPRCPDHYERKSVDQYPPSHMDVCSYCMESFENWREGLRADNKVRCERCGAETTNVQYCRDCQDVIDRRKARRIR